MKKIQGKTNQLNSGIYEKNDLCFEDILQSVKNHPDIGNAGSILSFIGIVRNTSKTGKTVNGLVIDAYDELAIKTINSICSDLKRERGIIEIKIVHFKGEFEISDDLVYVIVASAHRKEGFKILRKAVERYKNELTVWKKELLIEGNSEWIH